MSTAQVKSNTNPLVLWEDLKHGMFIKKDEEIYKVVNPCFSYMYIEPLTSYKTLVRKENFNKHNFTQVTKAESLKAHRAFIAKAIKVNELHYDCYTTIGCDPEIFITGVDEQVVPAWTLLKSKQVSTDSIYWDGFQAEFNVVPNTCMGYLGDNIHTMLTRLHWKLPTRTRLSHQSVIIAPDKELATAKREHVSLGCLPSLNAYGDIGAQVPDPRMLPFRFAGGHIHIGCTDDYKYNINSDPIPYVKAIDACLGMASVALFDSVDVSIRRQYYGLAGEYRLPPHGLEYRVLSNAWLTHPALAHWVFDMCRGSLHFARDLKLWFKGYSEDRIRKTINSGDVDDACKWIKQNQALYNGLAISHHREGADKIINHMYQNGVTSLIDVKDIVGNWHLTDDRWETHSEGPSCNFASFARANSAEGKAVV